MTLTMEDVTREALNLPPAFRAVLVDRLVESLSLEASDDIEREWAAEAVRRCEEVRLGLVQPIPGDEVLAEVRQLVGG